LEIWRFGDVEMWRCGDVEMWRCEDVRIFDVVIGHVSDFADVEIYDLAPR
jgi:hypothetical protein